MEIIINWILSFIVGNETRITPERWNDRTLIINIIVGAIVHGLGFLLAIIVLSIVIFSVGSEFTLGDYVLTISNFSKFTIVGLTLLFFIYSTYRKVLHEANSTDYLEIGNGYYGIINLLGKPRGSLDESFVLTPGSYRNIADFGFLAKDVFSIVTIDMRLYPMEFEYSGVKSKDGSKFSGKHSFLPFVFDPWLYHQLLFSIGYEGIVNFIEEISLENLYTTFDEFHSEEIMGGREIELVSDYKDTFNISLALRDNYLKSLSQNSDCRREGDHQNHLVNFYNGEKIRGKTKAPFDVYCIDATGLVGRFLLKTFDASDELQRAYDEKAAAVANIIKAEREALAKKETVDNDREMIERLVGSTLDEYAIRLGSDYKVTEEAIRAAKEDAMIIVDSFSEEKIYRLSNGDGKSIDTLSSYLIALLSKKSK